jgi:hypothetical protein
VKEPGPAQCLTGLFLQDAVTNAASHRIFTCEAPLQSSQAFIHSNWRERDEKHYFRRSFRIAAAWNYHRREGM